jgi:DNA-binding winged helix-turn-helix (wHTH) protein
VVRFGPYVLDSERHQIVHEGREIHLTPKAFTLVTVLIDAAPRVVPKAELHERLWPSGVVSDATLVGLVKEIRRALSDDDREQPLIRTVHRVGYALDAPVSRTSKRLPIARWITAGERRISLVDGENVIGRDRDANICLDYSTVSRRHARLVVTDGGAMLEDLGSKNGTTMNGERLRTAAPLRNGDRFACGQVLVVYQESDAGMPTATQASRVGEPSPKH